MTNDSEFNLLTADEIFTLDEDELYFKAIEELWDNIRPQLEPTVSVRFDPMIRSSVTPRERGKWLDRALQASLAISAARSKS